MNKEHQAETGERIPARDAGKFDERTQIAIALQATRRIAEQEAAECDALRKKLPIITNEGQLSCMLDTDGQFRALPSILQSAEDARRQALNGGAK